MPKQILNWTEGQCDWWGSTGNKPDDTAVWYTISQRQLAPQSKVLYHLFRGMVGDADKHLVEGNAMGSYHALDQAFNAAEADFILSPSL